MDALVYEDTPLATYFEGEALPYDLPRQQTPPQTPFAPKGLPNFKGRLRKIRRSATSIAPGSTYTEELLERLRYIIVASQLLSDELGPRAALPEHDPTTSAITTIRGAAVTAAISFLAAWAIHWLRTGKRTPKTLTWVEVGTYVVGGALIAVAALYFARRQYTNHLQRASLRTLTKYVDEARNFDLTANSAIRFVQEVEVVARGYELGSLLPPISRLEDRNLLRRCVTLRRELATVLKVLTIAVVEHHNAIQPYINTNDVQRYHDIYEVSMVEFSQAIELIDNHSEEPQGSLKELRFSLRLHSLSRKVFLCDLLALQKMSGWSRLHQWNHILRALREIQTDTTDRQISLSSTLSEEEWGNDNLKSGTTETASQSSRDGVRDNPLVRLQMRHFDDVTSSVRALNAKVHLFREEIRGLMNANAEDTVVASALSKHYESLGTELRSLMSDWERGRSSMLTPIDTDYERGSCSSGSVRTPISPSPSLGGLQIVDGGPADALRLLNGDSPSGDTQGLMEEEVFEAVASRLPRKRMSVSGMTREEKIAKLAEERKKRATMYEQADNTTNMLRELRMVIKHRPKGSLPLNNTATPNTIGNRVASL